MPRKLMWCNKVVWINDMHKITLIIVIHGMRMPFIFPKIMSLNRKFSISMGKLINF